jgi:hypothetical protein
LPNAVASNERAVILTDKDISCPIDLYSKQICTFEDKGPLCKGAGRLYVYQLFGSQERTQSATML